MKPDPFSQFLDFLLQIEVLLPALGALIGWLTNFVAVKMLFHPRKPFRLFWVYPIQGVFPKRQAALAAKLGEIVDKELLSKDDITKSIAESLATTRARNEIDNALEQFLTKRLPEIFPPIMLVMNAGVMQVAKDAIRKEILITMPKFVDSLMASAEDSIDTRALVERKVREFSSEKLEELIFSLMRKEFRFIELIGGLLGFFIGVSQVALINLL